MDQETPRLEPQIAVVTGASRGIGRVIALALARRGASVCLTARSRDGLERTAEEIRAADGRAGVCPCDVAKPGELIHVRDECTETLGPATVLVNNAGRLGAIGPTWECDPEEWCRDIDVNLCGALHGIHAFVPGMLERGAGRVINLVGGGTARAFPFASGYGTAKAGLMRLTETVAAELTAVRSAVKVFALSPGFVRTAMTEQFTRTARGREWMGRLAKRLEQQEDTPPEHAADVACYLASGKLDAYHGRMLHTERDWPRLTEMAERADETVDNDYRTLRVQFTK